LDIVSAPLLSNCGGHSTRVKMLLLVNGSRVAVVQMGSDFLLLEKPFDHPPTDASVVLQVDQNERRWNVHLPHGISAGSKRVAIAASLQPAPAALVSLPNILAAQPPDSQRLLM
jgi:hypothetical protein